MELTVPNGDICDRQYISIRDSNTSTDSILVRAAPAIVDWTFARMLDRRFQYCHLAWLYEPCESALCLCSPYWILTAGQKDDLHAVLGPFQTVHQLKSVHFRQAAVEQRNLKLLKYSRFEGLPGMLHADHSVSRRNKLGVQQLQLNKIVFDDK
jgi:hypothetical protein